jgi:hypothetical protein
VRPRADARVSASISAAAGVHLAFGRARIVFIKTRVLSRALLEELDALHSGIGSGALRDAMT